MCTRRTETVAKRILLARKNFGGGNKQFRSAATITRRTIIIVYSGVRENYGKILIIR